MENTVNILFFLECVQMDHFMNHIELEKPMPLVKQINYRQGDIVTEPILQSKSVTIALMAIDRKQKVMTTENAKDTLIYVLEGTAEVTIVEKRHIVTAGETIILPASKPHSIYALEQFKMMFIMLLNE